MNFYKKHTVVMCDFKIIESSSKEWDIIVKLADSYDFHHTSVFHQIDTTNPVRLLYFYSGASFIALPIVLRPIENTEFYDITSVYGYVGPVYHFENKLKEKELISFFQERFLKFCRQQRVVSVFSRLHPLIDQKHILKDFGEVKHINKTVSIDLTLSPAEQRRQYSKSVRSKTNQLRRKGYVVERVESNRAIVQFMEIYNNTMDRVKAAEKFYFPKTYYDKFLHNEAFKSELLLVKKNNTVVAGGILTLTDKIAQYHLSATARDYLQESPNKLLVDELRIRCNKTTVKDLHLGGGAGACDQDPLFIFKSRFSKNYKQFSIWEYIVDKPIYEELSSGKEGSDFFPLYRS